MISVFLHYGAIAVRTAIAFLFVIFVVSRLGKASVSSLSPSELVLCMLIGSSVQNAMVGGDTTLGGGIVASATLLTLNWALRRWRYHHPGFMRAMHDVPVVLVNDGVVMEKSLRTQLITKDELTKALREHGISKIGDVDLAVLETDGSISVLKREFKTPEALPDRTIEPRRARDFARIFRARRSEQTTEGVGARKARRKSH